MNSKDVPIEESNITMIDLSSNEIGKEIKGISYDFHPRSISITKVISTKTFLEAARAVIELMCDVDLLPLLKDKCC